MITWAFAYMHVNGPETIDAITFVWAVLADIFMVAMIAGAIRTKTKKDGE